MKRKVARQPQFMSTPGQNKVLHTANTDSGLTLKIHRGDGSALLAFNLEDHLTDQLAGFAVKRTGPDGKSAFLLNRLSFDTAFTAGTTAKDRVWTPSDKAPFQKFWWVDFPPSGISGEYRYEVTVMRFSGSSNSLKPDQSVNAALPLGPFSSGNLEMGFTRGYLSSQAYVDRFKNAKLHPEPQTIDFDTKPFQAQYEWLGYHARQMIFSFLEESSRDSSSRLDVFAYDLNEPDIIRSLCQIGSRLRIILDDAPLHKRGNTAENAAAEALSQAGAAVVRGHFGRFSHDKIFIKRDQQGKAVKVLTGSTNFSINGLCVNANNALIFNDPSVADYYLKVFELAFATHAAKSSFNSSNFATQEFEAAVPGLPHTYFSFAPHRSPTFSLDRLTNEIHRADSSVLFAVMGLGGGGSVLAALKDLRLSGRVFSYGVTDDTAEDGQNAKGGVEVFSPSHTEGVLVKAEALKKNVPAPFAAETSGDPGAHRIHHKFVVIDFNDSDPVLFTGSSNFSSGGEENNGDNLLAIYDRDVAGAFAIEAIRLVDHYQFRAAMSLATKADPLRLKPASTPWWKTYYDPSSLKAKERLLFAR
jgi:PLD-like domain